MANTGWNLVISILIIICLILIMIGFIKMTWAFWYGLLGDSISIKIPFVGNAS